MIGIIRIVCIKKRPSRFAILARVNIANMAVDEEAAVAAVNAAIFVVNKEDETFLDLPNALAVLYRKERRYIPRITGYVDHVVPAIVNR